MEEVIDAREASECPPSRTSLARSHVAGPVVEGNRSPTLIP